MDGFGKFTLLVTILAGSLLGGFLYFLTGSLSYPTIVQAAGSELDNQAEKSVGTENVTSKVDNPKNLKSLKNCNVSQSFSDDILQWCELITFYADQNGIEPDLLAALILQESGGNPQAYSHSGAVGLMQVMPRDGLAASFMCKNGPCFVSRPKIEQLQDPEFNISYGSKMLAGLRQKYGSMREALKYYGPMDAGYSYSDKVLGLYKRFRND